MSLDCKYICVHCNKVYNPRRHGVCPFCNSEQPIEKVSEYLCNDIVYVKCEKCGSDTSFKTYGETYCTKCRCWTSGDKIGEHLYSDIDSGRYFKELESLNSETRVKCPYCQSTNTRKISELSKAGSLALWGVFAIGKASKQWHCNNCKSDF